MENELAVGKGQEWLGSMGREGEPMWEPDLSSRESDKQTGILRNFTPKFNQLSSFLPFSTVYHRLLPASAFACGRLAGMAHVSSAGA